MINFNIHLATSDIKEKLICVCYSLFIYSFVYYLAYPLPLFHFITGSRPICFYHNTWCFRDSPHRLVGPDVLCWPPLLRTTTVDARSVKLCVTKPFIIDKKSFPYLVLFKSSIIILIFIIINVIIVIVFHA